MTACVDVVVKSFANWFAQEKNQGKEGKKIPYKRV